MVRTRFALILYFHMVAHKAACHTLSKASADSADVIIIIILLLVVVLLFIKSHLGK